MKTSQINHTIPPTPNAETQNKTYKLVAFDLDGTLVDSLPDLACSINQTFAEANLPNAPESKVMTWIGKGVEVLFANALEWTGRAQEFSDADIAHLKSRFDYFYGKNICNHSRLFPHVKETLEALKAQGYTLAVVTNKPTKHVHPVLEALNIAHLFTTFLGGHSLPAIKPHPGPLYYLCGKFGCYPHEILFVGDSENDIIAAKSAGCISVGLTYGYNYNIPIADSNPDYVFDDFSHILKITA